MLPSGLVLSVISIHALREEGDLQYSGTHRSPLRFLSTPSARRATQCSQSSRLGTKFLSTPSARRATYKRWLCDVLVSFLSTPSARRATRVHQGKLLRRLSHISIHALREEGDLRNPV